MPPPVDETLLKEHPAISFSMPAKKPLTPQAHRSPLSFAPQPGKEVVKSPVDLITRNGSGKREPVKRTRREEEEAYGRTFLGCGQITDYDITTKLGEGTFGLVWFHLSMSAFSILFREVHKAIQQSTGKIVALKRILMHNEKEGMPVTALREIKILKALHHPCIIDIVDMIMVRSG